MKFMKHAAHRKKRLGTAYRRPRGWHNKMRLSKKGHRPKVRDGYRTAMATRGKRKGLNMVRVANPLQLETLDPKKDGIVIANVGGRKRLLILNAIKEKGFTLFTGKPDDAIKSIEADMSARRKDSEARDKEKEAKKKEAEKKEADEKKEAEKKDKLEEKLDTEEAKKKEKEEKDKVLTKAR